MNDACLWYIQVEPQYHIEVVIDKLNLFSNENTNCSFNSFEVKKKYFFYNLFILYIFFFKFKIYDNQILTNRTRILRLCETQTGEPLIIRTSGNYAIIYLRVNPLKINKC